MGIEIKFGAGTQIPAGTVIEYAGERQVLVNGISLPECDHAELAERVTTLVSALVRIRDESDNWEGYEAGVALGIDEKSYGKEQDTNKD